MYKQILLIAGGILVLLLIGFFLIRSIPSLVNRPAVQPVVTTTPISATKTDVISVSDIVTHPVVYQGLTLTVQSTVSDWVTKQAFVLGSSGGGLIFPSSGGLLAIRKEPFKLPSATPGNDLALGQRVQVTTNGTIEVLNVSNLEQAWGMTLEHDLLDSWNNQPVLIVNKVTVVTAR